MSVETIRKTAENAKRFGVRLCREVKGTASIEFMTLVPMLIIFMVGTLEISRAINVDRRVNAATSMAGDLVSREQDLGGNPTTTLNSIMEVVAHVMHPYDEADLRLSVIPVMADAVDETRTFVYATPYNYNGGVGSVPAKDSCYTFPAGTSMMSKGSSVIIVKAEFDYEPMLEGFFDSFTFIASAGADWDDSATYTDQAVHSPRNGCVDFDGNNCVVATPGGC